MNLRKSRTFTEVFKGGLSDDEFRLRVEAARRAAQHEALSLAGALVPDVRSPITDSIPSAFGVKHRRSTEDARKRMIDRCGVDAHELMVLAIRVFEFGKREEPFFLEQLIEMCLSDDDGRIGSEVDPGGDDRQADSEIDPDENDAKVEELLSPDLNADSQGWAWMAYTALSKTDLPKSKLMFGLQLCEFPSASQILDALGVYWFFEAARLSNAGDGRALDVLFESSGAFELARVVDADDEAEEWARDDQSYALHLLAKKAAKARHAENHETAERIHAWYVENHHRFPSMDKAAEAVMRIEPVAFKTARKHIGAAAKKLPSARKE